MDLQRVFPDARIVYNDISFYADRARLKKEESIALFAAVLERESSPGPDRAPRMCSVFDTNFQGPSLAKDNIIPPAGTPSKLYQLPWQSSASDLRASFLSDKEKTGIFASYAQRLRETGPGHLFHIDHHYPGRVFNLVSTTVLLVDFLQYLHDTNQTDLISRLQSSFRIADHSDWDILLPNYILARHAHDLEFLREYGDLLKKTAVLGDYQLWGLPNQKTAEMLWPLLYALDRRIQSGEYTFSQAMDTIDERIAFAEKYSAEMTANELFSDVLTGPADAEHPYGRFRPSDQVPELGLARDFWEASEVYMRDRAIFESMRKRSRDDNTPLDTAIRPGTIFRQNHLLVVYLDDQAGEVRHLNARRWLMSEYPDLLKRESIKAILCTYHKPGGGRMAGVSSIFSGEMLDLTFMLNDDLRCHFPGAGGHALSGTLALQPFPQKSEEFVRDMIGHVRAAVDRQERDQLESNFPWLPGDVSDEAARAAYELYKEKLAALKADPVIPIVTLPAASAPPGLMATPATADGNTIRIVARPPSALSSQFVDVQSRIRNKLRAIAPEALRETLDQGLAEISPDTFLLNFATVRPRHTWMPQAIERIRRRHEVREATKALAATRRMIEMRFTRIVALLPGKQPRLVAVLKPVTHRDLRRFQGLRAAYGFRFPDPTDLTDLACVDLFNVEGALNKDQRRWYGRALREVAADLEREGSESPLKFPIRQLEVSPPRGESDLVALRDPDEYEGAVREGEAAIAQAWGLDSPSQLTDKDDPESVSRMAHLSGVLGLFWRNPSLRSLRSPRALFAVVGAGKLAAREVIELILHAGKLDARELGPEGSKKIRITARYGSPGLLFKVFCVLDRFACRVSSGHQTEGRLEDDPPETQVGITLQLERIEAQDFKDALSAIQMIPDPGLQSLILSFFRKWTRRLLNWWRGVVTLELEVTMDDRVRRAGEESRFTRMLQTLITLDPHISISKFHILTRDGKITAYLSLEVPAMLAEQVPGQVASAVNGTARFVSIVAISRPRIAFRSFWWKLKEYDMRLATRVPIMNLGFQVFKRLGARRWPLVLLSVFSMAAEMFGAYTLADMGILQTNPAWMEKNVYLLMTFFFAGWVIVAFMYSGLYRLARMNNGEKREKKNRDFRTLGALYSSYGPLLVPVIFGMNLQHLFRISWLIGTLALIPWGLTIVTNLIHLWEESLPRAAEADTVSEGRKFGAEAREMLDKEEAFIAVATDMDGNSDFVNALGPRPHGREIVNLILQDLLWREHGVIAEHFREMHPTLMREYRSATWYNIGGDETYILIPMAAYMERVKPDLRLDPKTRLSEDEIRTYAQQMVEDQLKKMQTSLAIRSGLLMKALSRSLIEIHASGEQDRHAMIRMLRDKMDKTPIARASDAALGDLVDPPPELALDGKHPLLNFIEKHASLPTMTFSLTDLTDQDILSENPAVTTTRESRPVFRIIRALLADSMKKAKGTPGKHSLVRYTRKGQQAQKPKNPADYIKLENLLGQYRTLFTAMDPNAPIPGLKNIPEKNQFRTIDEWMNEVGERYRGAKILFVQLAHDYRVTGTPEVDFGGLKYLNTKDTSLSSVDPLAIIERLVFVDALSKALESDPQATVLTGQYADRLFAAVIPGEGTAETLISIFEQSLDTYKRQLSHYVNPSIWIRTFASSILDICTAGSMSEIRRRLNALNRSAPVHQVPPKEPIEVVNIGTTASGELDQTIWDRYWEDARDKLHAALIHLEERFSFSRVNPRVLNQGA